MFSKIWVDPARSGGAGGLSPLAHSWRRHWSQGYLNVEEVKLLNTRGVAEYSDFGPM